MNQASERQTFFADVIVPLPVPGLFTYRIPHEMSDQVETGKRVVVQFGAKKIYAGLVARVHEEIPQHYIPKYIQSILDDKPVVNKLQLKFWDWIVHYYMCYHGEVMQAGLPSSLRLSSETGITLAEGFKPDALILGENEYLITEALLIQQRISLSEVAKIVGFQKVMPLINSMIANKIIVMEEELRERFIPKTETVVTLTEAYREEAMMEQLMKELSIRAYKQLELLLAYLSIERLSVSTGEGVGKRLLLEKSGAGHVQLKSLADKGVFHIQKKVVSRFSDQIAIVSPGDLRLSEAQQQALLDIKKQFHEKEVVLLHGVTSSGKTEIYIKLIHEALESGKQVLYLLPEIALTTQIINRLKKFFGTQVGVYHSRYNPHEKAEIWNDVLSFEAGTNNRHQVILGPRSALFLPFQNLGLIIVDEEHDTSYKQQDPAPRYHARDASIMLSSFSGARVLLGTATPSLESYFNAKSKRFGLVELSERYGGTELPEVIVVNLREETRRKTMKSHFSAPLVEAIGKALGNKEQVILFQNRRGFSLRLECDHCHYVPQCNNCDVSLIYHKKQQLLRCHYCGYSLGVPSECPECRSTALRMHGFGTEKVEEELGILMPQAKIGRLDLDTTRSKNAFQQILEDFEQGRIDILTGTQMVTKGLDFGRVKVVGILNSDSMLSYPDFRAFERSFQLMTQVSGRAGRKNQRGKVFIQSYQPGHPLLNDVVNHRFENMYRHQLSIREHYHYPPYYRLILIVMKHRDANMVNHGAAELTLGLRDKFPGEVLGPEFPMVSRIKNLYIKQIMLKIPRQQSSSTAKEVMLQLIRHFSAQSAYKAIKISIDVDPY
jgi:primosomal protein N' (replication factor Y)